ncbi:MAG: AAA family ATPase [Chromatiales bacterium]|nr:AAA family ATPase [Chromatiales bacterium]
MQLRFQAFELDIDRREFRAQGRPVSMPPRAFAVLGYLIEHRDRMVSKRELLDAFWPSNVSESALLKAVSLIRKALASDEPVVKTYHGLGYRFVAEVEDVAVKAEDQPESTDPVALLEQRLVSVLGARFRHLPASFNEGECHDPALDAYLTSARRIVEAHQGRLLHMMVDGFSVAFGLDPHYEDVARRAVCCAAELAQAAGTSGGTEKPLTLAWGIDTGPIALNNDKDNPQWTPPNALERSATRLAEAGLASEILLSEATCQQLHDEVETEATARGYRLISIPLQRAGIPGRPHKRPSRFVGRAAELAFLSTRLCALASGSGQAILLCGPAGIGKTRLVTEFVDTLAHQAVRCISLHCLPGRSNTPFAPIREMCLALFTETPAGLLADDIDAALLRGLRNDSGRFETALQGLSDNEQRRRNHALIDRLIRFACDELPLVLIIEDVHWIDASSREYLDALLSSIDGRRLMLVLTSRPVDSPIPVESALQLAPLSRCDSLQLLRSDPQTAPIDTSTADTLVQRAGGNPFFLEELALATLSGADPAIDLPDTIHAVIAVRIGALAGDLRTLLYILSVIGPPAPTELVAELSGQTGDQVTAGLDQLAKLGFIREESGTFTFRHMLIQDTAYAMIARRDRRQLHRRIARYIEHGAPSELSSPERLAWHYQEAGETDRAIAHWIAAGRAALWRSARHEATVFARSGLALIDPSVPDQQRQELDLQLCLASSLTALRGFGAHEVGLAYHRAQQLSETAGTGKTRIRALVGLWIHTWVRGQLGESLSHAQTLMELATAAGDPALHLQAHASLGQVLMHTGQLEHALAHLKTGLGYIEDLSPETIPAQNAAVACAAYAAWVASLLGRSGEARHFHARSEQLSLALKNPFAVAIHHALCAEHLMIEGNVTECLRYAEQAVAVSREHNFPFWLGTGLVMRGWALGQQGVFDDGLNTVNEGIAVFESTGAGVQLANWYGLKAETLLAAGQLREGIEAARHALNCAERAEDLYFVPRIHAVAARLNERLGTNDAPQWHKKQANTLARRFGLARRAVVLDASPHPPRKRYRATPIAASS